MRLEEEIKQKEFNNEYQKIIVNILFTSSWLSSKQSRLFRSHGISSQQYNVLRILRGKHPEPATVNLITDRMLDKNSNASRLVEKLLNKKLIARTTSKVDRRRKEVKISKAGLKLLDAIDNEFSAFEKQFHTLSVNEAEHLNKLLDKLRG